MAEPAAAVATPVLTKAASGSIAAADRGRLVIADKVVERIATIAAGEIEWVGDPTSGWTRVIGRGLPRATAKVAGGRTRVLVQVAGAWPAPLASMASAVRDHVNERISTLTGVTVTAVDVTVADVTHPESGARRVQ